MSVPVILASASPRRRQLLDLIGINHTVMPADIDETQFGGEAPGVYAERLARTKASTIAGRHPSAVVVGADTIVIVDGDVLGKPADGADAARMLRRLSGRTHVVQTAVAVARGDAIASCVETVTVTFRELDDKTIAEYVETGEPLDKAGAYGIQGYGAVLVHRIDGDYFSVMGLGLGAVTVLLRELGLRYDFSAGVLPG
jgi:septum formation protein